MVFRIWDFCHEIIISLLAISETNKHRHLIPNAEGHVFAVKKPVSDREDVFGYSMRFNYQIVSKVMLNVWLQQGKTHVVKQPDTSYIKSHAS